MHMLRIAALACARMCAARLAACEPCVQRALHQQPCHSWADQPHMAPVDQDYGDVAQVQLACQRQSAHTVTLASAEGHVRTNVHPGADTAVLCSGSCTRTQQQPWSQPGRQHVAVLGALAGRGGAVAAAACQQLAGGRLAAGPAGPHSLATGDGTPPLAGCSQSHSSCGMRLRRPVPARMLTE